MKKIPFKEILKAAGVFLIGATVIFITAKLTDLSEEPQQLVVLPPEITKQVIGCPSDFDSFSSTTKKTLLVEDKPSNGFDKVLKGYRVDLERTGLTSEIACGYLFYEISFENKPIEQDFMALFMRPSDGQQFGGHILPDESKGAIVNVLSDRTQVLIPLNKIVFDGTDRINIKEVNWASLLNVATKVQFEVALSANVQNGTLNRVEIAYKCVNTDTGKETDTCSLNVADVTPFGFE